MRNNENRGIGAVIGIVGGAVGAYFLVETVRWTKEVMSVGEADLYKKAMVGLVFLSIVGFLYMISSSSSDGRGGGHLR